MMKRTAMNNSTKTKKNRMRPTIGGKKEIIIVTLDLKATKESMRINKRRKVIQKILSHK